MGEMNKGEGRRGAEAKPVSFSAERSYSQFLSRMQNFSFDDGFETLFAPELDLGEGEKKAVQRTEPHWSRANVVRPPSSEPNVRRNPLLSRSSSLHQAFFWQ
ncbi:hypothetical protein HPP92_027179 [Vanilla planifolia]|uniref:Uncharacterized protein n=1 Tax=Vanilla planifolia TaxID=51239 RepID=A0A835PE46_VANPL|nr:hypothetical protein HPP92_027179 [Vanilla planifolia]